MCFVELTVFYDSERCQRQRPEDVVGDMMLLAQPSRFLDLFAAHEHICEQKQQPRLKLGLNLLIHRPFVHQSAIRSDQLASYEKKGNVNVNNQLDRVQCLI